MSPSPTTPEQVTMHPTENSSKAIVYCTGKLTSASKFKQTSFNEPSPASTYGETNVGNSTPATPLGGGDYDNPAGITMSMHVVQLDPAIASISGSSIPSHEGQNHQEPEPRAGHAVYIDGLSKSMRNTGLDHLVHNISATSSPHSDDVCDVHEAQEWRGPDQGKFVRHSGKGTDDPFVSSGTIDQSAGQEATFIHHPDRIGEQPTNNTAQAILPPQACVFVANLTQSDTDDQLQHAVTQTFAQFGKVWIKIRRDARQMPFAFAQYENVEDARRAITLGRGMLINGRPCRTEVAKVNRSLYLSKITGGSISEVEARQVMAGFGPIQRVWHCSQTDREIYRLPEGIFIMFAFYDDCRDAQMKFRDHPTHRLEQPKSIEDIRSHLGSRSHPFANSPLPYRSPERQFSPPSARRVADICSIFVGNLPPHISEENLYSMFQIYGRIKHVEIVRKPSVVNTAGINAFAFIEYVTPDCATKAIQASPTMFQGFRLRVERKETGTPSPRRTRFSSGSPAGGALDSQEALVIYQRGVSMGISQAAQAQIAPPPVYAQYPYYQPYDASLGQYAPPSTAVLPETSLSFQAYGNSYMAQPLSQLHIPLALGPYAHFQTTPPQTAQNPNQLPAQHPSQALRPYHWPLVEGTMDVASGSPAPANHETQ